VYEWAEVNCPHILPKRLNSDDANIASRYGSIQTLQWLANGGFKGKQILPTIHGMSLAAAFGRIDVLQWGCDQNIVLDSSVADSAADKGQLLVVKWLADREIWPSPRGAVLALINGELNTLKWLYERGQINPLRTLTDERLTAYNTGRYCNCGSVQARRWLISKVTVSSDFRRNALNHYMKHLSDNFECGRAINWLIH
jgi:hypothetical protein